MKIVYLVLLVIFLAACATKQAPEEEVVLSDPDQKIVIKGTRVKESELPSGLKMKMTPKKQNGGNYWVLALAVMQALPQPKDIGDCQGLLSSLSQDRVGFTVVDANIVTVDSENATYEYIFDDESCPVD